MNRLQSITSRAPILVSLNPPHPPAAEKTFAQMVYAHPQFDHAALRAQEQLSAIQGRDRLWFCGSYFGYGFHEDALASGLAVAEALGAKRPWSVTDISPAFANATPVP
jgi:predicted NAD/FAD-binding protein